MHISVTVHLKPVDVFLFRQAQDIPHRRKNRYPLFQLVKTQLDIVIHHAMIADAAFIQIGIAFVIRDVVP